MFHFVFICIFAWISLFPQLKHVVNWTLHTCRFQAENELNGIWGQTCVLKQWIINTCVHSMLCMSCFRSRCLVAWGYSGNYWNVWIETNFKQQNWKILVFVHIFHAIFLFSINKFKAYNWKVQKLLHMKRQLTFSIHAYELPFSHNFPTFDCNSLPKLFQRFN